MYGIFLCLNLFIWGSRRRFTISFDVFYKVLCFSLWLVFINVVTRTRTSRSSKLWKICFKNNRKISKVYDRKAMTEGESCKLIRMMNAVRSNVLTSSTPAPTISSLDSGIGYFQLDLHKTCCCNIGAHAQYVRDWSCWSKYHIRLYDKTEKKN